MNNNKNLIKFSPLEMGDRILLTFELDCLSQKSMPILMETLKELCILSGANIGQSISNFAIHCSNEKYNKISSIFEKIVHADNTASVVKDLLKDNIFTLEDIQDTVSLISQDLFIAARNNLPHSSNKDFLLEATRNAKMFNKIEPPQDMTNASIWIAGAKRTYMDIRIEFLFKDLNQVGNKINPALLTGARKLSSELDKKIGENRQETENFIKQFGENGTETDMMVAKYIETAMQFNKNHNHSVIDTPKRSDGSRPNTADTVILATKKIIQSEGRMPGKIILISNQPHINRQEKVTRLVIKNLGHDSKVFGVGPGCNINENTLAIAIREIAAAIFESRIALDSQPGRSINSSVLKENYK